MLEHAHTSQVSLPLRVATINFACPNTSPFEYHDGSDDLIKLNEVFTRHLARCPEYATKNFSWEVGKIDVLMKKPRYCVFYNKDACVIDNRFVTKEEFNVIWDYEYQKNKHILGNNVATEQMVKQVKLFDWLAYQSLVDMLYGVDVNVNEQLKKLDVKPFRNFLKSRHCQNYFHTREKINWVLRYIKNKDLDVLFIQQSGSIDWENQVSQLYKVARNRQSVIIYKQHRFPAADSPFKQQFQEKYGSKMNFNNDSAYVMLGNVLLMCVHLTSKPHRVEQAIQFLKVVREIMIDFPKIQVLVGMDANQQLSPQDFISGFPLGKDLVTTRKKRTMMQMQYHKSDVLIQEAKDYILTNDQLRDGKVQTIKESSALQNLLPNENHPFDHFIVTASVQIEMPQLHLSKKSQN